jgi:hypothetical protein
MADKVKVRIGREAGIPEVKPQGMMGDDLGVDRLVSTVLTGGDDGLIGCSWSCVLWCPLSKTDCGLEGFVSGNCTLVYTQGQGFASLSVGLSKVREVRLEFVV